MKIKNIIIITLMIILLSMMVSATEYDVYGFNRHYGSLDENTYNSYSTHTNGVSYSNLSSCSVGYGTDKGVYPISVSSATNNFRFLVIPTTNALKLVNSNCSELHSVTVANVNLYGTMSTFVRQTENGNEINDFVFVGENSSSGKFGFYSFRLNYETQEIEYQDYKEIGGGFEADHFQGVACGWETEVFSTTGGCGMVNGTTLYYWDMISDSLSSYTTPVDVQRNYDIENPLSHTSGVEVRSFDTIPYGGVADFDNDNNNEMFFGAIIGDDTNVKYNFFGFDMNSKSFQFSYSLDALQPYEMVGQPVVPIQPCQIGGRLSNMEICVSGRAWQPSSLRYELSYEIFDISGTSLWSLNPTHRNIIPIATLDYDDDGEYEFLAGKHLYESDYNLIGSINNYTYDTSSRYDATFGQPSFLMDVTGDETLEIIIGNGSVFGTDDSVIPFTFSSQAENKESYIVGGDLNNDFKNEIIFSSASNTYIFSENPTNDYVYFIGTPTGSGNCTFTEATYSVCESLITNEDCTETIIDSCFEELSIEEFTCPYSEQVSVSGCSELITYEDCTTYHINKCYEEFTSTGATGDASGLDGAKNIFEKVELNAKSIVGIFIVIAMITISATELKIKNPLVLIFIGIMGAIVSSLLGLFSSAVLVLILVVLLILLLLSMTIFKHKED